MAELDAYLDDDRAAQERLSREREARERAEERSRAARPGASSGPPPRLVAAYSTLGLSYGASFEQAKAAYKRLLKQHHPDRHGSSQETLKVATEKSARINDAFRIIETWHDTGTMGDE
jgi:DnaJ-domain-containing protein 1